jgi:hypothetical protein
VIARLLRHFGLAPPLHQAVVLGGRVVGMSHPGSCADRGDPCAVSTATAPAVMPDGIWRVRANRSGVLVIDSLAVARP